MTKISKPMLAATLENVKTVKYPVLCTEKIDGIRALVINGRLVSRTFKPIPNEYIRGFLEEEAVDGMDGELVVGKQFNETSSGVMRESGTPDFKYVVFDYLVEDEGYKDRMERLKKLKVESGRIQKLLPVQINNEKELIEYERMCLNSGFEGVMLRSVDGPYKMGRSTPKQAWLLKWKRFTDGEAIVVDVFEKMKNENEAMLDAFGHTVRSSHKAGKVGADTLGGFTVKDVVSGVVFGIGSGFDDEFRRKVWSNPEKYIGKIVKYKHFNYGAVDAPRMPIFLGFRDVKDMSKK